MLFTNTDDPHELNPDLKVIIHFICFVSVFLKSTCADVSSLWIETCFAIAIETFIFPVKVPIRQNNSISIFLQDAYLGIESM